MQLADQTGGLRHRTGNRGAYESGCAPCDTAVEEMTWGAVKALFR